MQRSGPSSAEREPAIPASETGRSARFPGNDGRRPGARRFVYVENQFFASRVIGKAILARLGEPDGPEFVLVNPKKTDGRAEADIAGVASSILATPTIKKLASPRGWLAILFNPPTANTAGSTWRGPPPAPAERLRPCRERAI